MYITRVDTYALFFNVEVHIDKKFSEFAISFSVFIVQF